MLYQCETGDDKQSAGERPFLSWFRDYARSNDYVIKVSEIVAEIISNYAAIIVQKSNPNSDLIIQEFNDFVGAEQAEIIIGGFY